MKKLILLILCFVCAIFAVGCGVYSPPITPGTDSGTENPDDGKKPGDGTEDKNVIFTVTLVSGGRNYTPDRTIKAQWTGNDGIFTEEFNSRGVATCDKLDGDYRVTLSNLPDTFTYNPNGIYVDNDHPSVTIELLPISRADRSEGTGPYRTVELRSAGTYRGTLDSPTDKIWYSFKPGTSGWYSLQSWVDIEANEINPIVDDYGTNAFNVPSVPLKIYNDGGASSTYTKNFRFDVQMAAQYTGNSWVFVLRAESVSDVNFPATVDFTIMYEDDWVDEEEPFEEQVANGIGEGEFPYYAGYSELGTWTYSYAETANLLDGSRFKLWSVDEGGDGCYHLYDSATDAYGALLFAKITKDTAVFATSSQKGFTDDELQWHSLTLVGEDDKRKDYGKFVNTYALWCVGNAEGAYPVTEELKQFLQDYAVSQRLFNDGYGIAETEDRQNRQKPILKSNEENQWLFACGYYK